MSTYHHAFLTTLALALCLATACGSAEPAVTPPCPPLEAGCPSCFDVYQGANPASICPNPAQIGCGNAWAPLEQCGCSLCAAECSGACPAFDPATAPATCKPCLEAKCGAELAACLGDV